nr:hypothetical protein [Streptomyces odonnellii]
MFVDVVAEVCVDTADDDEVVGGARVGEAVDVLTVAQVEVGTVTYVLVGEVVGAVGELLRADVDRVDALGVMKASGEQVRDEIPAAAEIEDAADPRSGVGQQSSVVELAVEEADTGFAEVERAPGAFVDAPFEQAGVAGGLRQWSGLSV